MNALLWRLIVAAGGLSCLWYVRMSERLVLTPGPGKAEFVFGFGDLPALGLYWTVAFLFLLVLSLLAMRQRGVANQEDDKISSPARASIKPSMAQLSSLYAPSYAGYVALLGIDPLLSQLFPLAPLWGYELLNLWLGMILAATLLVFLTLSGFHLVILKGITVFRTFLEKRKAFFGLQAAVFLASAGIYLFISPYLPGLNGDEPHYLLIVQSLIQDGDLDVNNNYVNRDYNAYIPGVLDRHVSIGRGGVRYSTHPVGVAFLLAPAYALGGYSGVVFFLNVLAAVLSWQLFLLFYHRSQKLWMSLLLWVLVSFSPPLLPYSSKVFPELPAALLCILAYRTFLVEARPTRFQVVIGSLSLALLPWLQQRYILMSLVLAAWCIIRKKGVIRWLSSLPVGLSLVGLSFFYYRLYGTPLPSAPYSSIHMNTIWSWKIFWHNGFLGLLLDQEFGLLLYSPIFFFMLPGFLAYFRRRREHSLLLLALVLTVYVPAAGFTLKWFGSWCPAGRYLVVLIPLFADCLVMYFRRPLTASLKWLLSVLVILTLYWDYKLVTTYDIWIGAENGRSKLLSLVSQGVDLPRFFPSFIIFKPSHWLIVSLWVGLLALLTPACHRYSSVTLAPRRKPPVSPESPSAGTALPSAGISFIRWFVQCTAFVLLFSGLIYHGSRLVTSTARSAAPRAHPSTVHTSFGSSNNTEEYYQLTITPQRTDIASRGTPSYVVSGPYLSLAPGIYQASFELRSLAKPETAHADAESLALDITSIRGHRVHAQRTIKASELTPEGKNRVFTLYFELTEPTTNIETRVFSNKKVDFIIERIHLETNADLTALYQGKILFRRGFYRQSLEKLRAVPLTAPIFYQSLIMRAEIEIKQGNYSQALTLIRRFQSLCPKDYQSLERVGKLLLKTPHREEGISLLQSVHQPSK